MGLKWIAFQNARGLSCIVATFTAFGLFGLAFAQDEPPDDDPNAGQKADRRFHKGHVANMRKSLLDTVQRSEVVNRLTEGFCAVTFISSLTIDSKEGGPWFTYSHLGPCELDKEVKPDFTLCARSVSKPRIGLTERMATCSVG